MMKGGGDKPASTSGHVPGEFVLAHDACDPGVLEGGLPSCIGISIKLIWE